MSYDTLVGLYSVLNPYDKLLLFYNKSLNIRENILGFFHYDTGQSHNNISVLYVDMGLIK